MASARKLSTCIPCLPPSSQSANNSLAQPSTTKHTSFPDTLLPSLVSKKLASLDTIVVDIETFFNPLQSHAKNCVETRSWLDLTDFTPPVATPEDIEMLLESTLSDGMTVSDIHRIGDNIIISKGFLEDLCELLLPYIRQCVNSPSTLSSSKDFNQVRTHKQLSKGKAKKQACGVDTIPLSNIVITEEVLRKECTKVMGEFPDDKFEFLASFLERSAALNELYNQMIADAKQTLQNERISAMSGCVKDVEESFKQISHSLRGLASVTGMDDTTLGSNPLGLYLLKTVISDWICNLLHVLQVYTLASIDVKVTSQNRQAILLLLKKQDVEVGNLIKLNDSIAKKSFTDLSDLMIAAADEANILLRVPDKRQTKRFLAERVTEIRKIIESLSASDITDVVYRGCQLLLVQTMNAFIQFPNAYWALRLVVESAKTSSRKFQESFENILGENYKICETISKQSKDNICLTPAWESATVTAIEKLRQLH